MKCFQGNTRGIGISKPLSSGMQMPVVFADSLYLRGNASFGDKIVFADAEKREGKLILSAAASDDDSRALVFFQSDDMKDDTDADDCFRDSFEANGAEILHQERVDQYYVMGLYSSIQHTVMVMEPGSSVTLVVARTFTHQPGFFAGLFGARAWHEEHTKRVRVSYDGDIITTEALPLERRTLMLELPIRGGWRPHLA